MKKTTFLLFFISSVLHSQTIPNKPMESAILGQTKELKICLPWNYEKNIKKSYPLILVLNGDYLFEPVAGNVHYYSYWNEMPESIVVGVNQAGLGEMNTAYGRNTAKRAAFYGYIKNELMPRIKRNYRTTDFTVIVGYGHSANFMNYFLLRDLTMFDAYVNLSPLYTSGIADRIKNELSTIDAELWYYMAIGSNEPISTKNRAFYLKKELNSIENEKLHVHFDNFEGKNHHSVVGFAVPAALQSLFLPYGPILPEEYNKIVSQKDTYCEYLLNKYNTIEDLYGLRPKIRINDLMAIAAAIEKNKKWKEYEELSKIAQENYPKTMLPDYFEARFYESTGKPEKALSSYGEAYKKKEISFLTADLIWKRIKKLKKDFGY